jgi:hypothetical protein
VKDQEFIVAFENPSWDEFAAENPDLLNRKSNLILRDYYFDETLASELARKLFVLPNRTFASHRGGGSQ